MTPAETRAFNLGVEAVRKLARQRVVFWRTKMRTTGFLVDKWIVGARWIERDAAELLQPENKDHVTQEAPQ